MSIVASVLGKLQLIGAIWQKIAAFETKLTALRRPAESGDRKRSREWFYASHGNAFNNMQQARKGFSESLGTQGSLGRIPVTR